MLRASDIQQASDTQKEEVRTAEELQRPKRLMGFESYCLYSSSLQASNGLRLL